MIDTRTMRGRYLNDNDLRYLVDMLKAMIYQCQFTPSELRSAAILASILYEEEKIYSRPDRLDKVNGINEKLTELSSFLNEKIADL